jgi:hypothetical protein
MVTHVDVTDADVEETLNAWRSIASEAAPSRQEEA